MTTPPATHPHPKHQTDANSSPQPAQQQPEKRSSPRPLTSPASLVGKALKKAAVAVPWGCGVHILGVKYQGLARFHKGRPGFYKGF